VQTRIKTSNLCDPPKSQLADKAAALKATGGGSDAAAALQAAQSAYNALNDLLETSPRTPKRSGARALECGGGG
jgi:hypothetical protein